MIDGNIKEAADNICKEINRYKKEIFENIKKEDIAIYLWLMDAYNQGEYLRDRSKYPFQIVFKSFYGMNRAGLSKNAVEKFFELLENKLPWGKVSGYSNASLNAPRSEKFDSLPFILGTEPRTIPAGK